MSDLIKTRVASALLGLAIGESLSWSSMFSRAQALPEWLERNRRTMEADLRKSNSTSFPKPFSLNQSPDKLMPGPGDTTEWAVWTALLLLENQGNLSHEILQEAWQKLAETPAEIHGRISVQATLRNIKSGLTAPATGRFNPHYFDDAALPRAAMIGVTHPGNPDVAIVLAEQDASFTQFEDGVWSAIAVSAIFSQASSGVPVPKLIQNAVNMIPADSLTKTTVNRALNGINPTQSSVVNTAYYLNAEICNQIYSYGNIAHEILASLLAILKTTGGKRDLMTGCAALVPPCGGTLLALSSALGAVIEGESLIGNIQNHLLGGDSIPSLNGVDINHIGNQLSELAVAGSYAGIKGKLLL